MVYFTSVEGLRTSAEHPFIRRKALDDKNTHDYHDDPRLLVSFVFAKSANCPNRTLTSFPFASYTIGFASGFALHTLRKMVVLPEFALPMMRIRNRAHSSRISSALKAPCLTGGSPDDRASLFTVDIAGEGEECAVNMKIEWSEINLGRYHNQEPLLPFLDEAACSFSSSAMTKASRFIL